MPVRGRWLWLFRPEAMVALVVTAGVLLALGIAMRAGDDSPGNDELRIVSGALAAPTSTSRAASGTSSAGTSSPDTPAVTPVATASATATTAATAGADASLTATATEPPALTGMAAAPARATGESADAGLEAGSEAATAVGIMVEPAQVGVGETMLVRVRSRGADSGSLSFRGQSFPLSVNGEELWAVVGVPVQAAVGPATLSVTTRDPAGNVIATEEAAYEVVPVERPIQNLILTEEESSVLTAEAGQRELELRQQQFARFDRGRRWNGRFVRPLAGPITTLFGEGRRINGGPPGSFHSGTDIANDQGTPVVAAAAARVAWTGEMPIRGSTVILDHGAGVLTHYSHLSAIHVSVNQIVHPGETIGLVGSTGLSTGPHLHWELSIYGVNVDPLQWVGSDFTP